MECVLQWLDNLDDLAGAIASQAERLRRVAVMLFSLLATAVAAAAAVLVAVSQPPVAMALACLLTVTYLYRSVVNGTVMLVRS